ncbi:MAG: glucose 1-dehydrogenase [Natronomonas sp.]|jgi:NAD(P)-dependent dehydrogenase (short-subunit alcohol dehydrogenase family)|uniref:SDR family NAD(P)-dependent oxidoreductase n=1 Tax=Natronomonas sp. TaxID=2184060 RepID=UPI00286FE19E|nr:glucose 1-dehydrogenase [Natronomonas sp.]MDR9381673.1 glucose 1-dehydrogenase [Natronomonas sp.]MDR9431880.1 glucose 1-dehydrogenase [Natronomonas sp.]
MEAQRHVDRTVVVTGAASGIGRGIAIRFGTEGANVLVADVRREPKRGERYDTDATVPTDEVVSEETSGDGTFVETDVSDPESVELMIETAVDTYGGLDVLVNNAGIQIIGDSQAMDIEGWARSLEVDLSGVFYAVKYAVPHIVERSGQILNIGSVRGFEGGGGPAYAAAKGGVVNMTRDLARELGTEDVRVNCINPGYIETPLQDYLSEEDIERSAEQTLLPRFGTPEDIGDVAVFLASEEASFITGANVPVDGGWLAHSGV